MVVEETKKVTTVDAMALVRGFESHLQAKAWGDRVTLGDLAPQEATGYGRWRITVEFWPEARAKPAEKEPLLE